jgi:predicted HTH domain antitoxin
LLGNVLEIIYLYICIMRTVTLNLPETLDMDDQEITMSLAAKLYENGKLSIGQSAELVGLTKRTFMELLGKYGVSIFNYPASDLSRDVRNA